jgi:predicted ATPase
VTALAWACIFRDLRREAEAVRRHARELMKVASEQGTEQGLATGTILDGCVRAELGEGEAAVAQIGQGIDLYMSTGAELFLPYFLSLQARAHVAVGQPDVALGVVREALTRARATGELVWEPELVRLEGEFRLGTRSADVGSALESFHRAIAIAQGEQARSWQLRAAVSLAHVLAANGERDQARRTLADVYDAFTEGFDTADLRDAQSLLKDLAAR